MGGEVLGAELLMWFFSTLSKEVRFKNNGLDSIEVQDNGGGIAPENYENLGMSLSKLVLLLVRSDLISPIYSIKTLHVQIILLR